MNSEQRNIFEDPWLKARQLKARRKYDAAGEVLTQALEQQPDNLKLRASMADLHYRMGHLRRAMAEAGVILAEDPNDPRALVVMGNSLLAKGDQPEALVYFQLAAQIAPTDYLWGRVARCHLEAKQPQEALDALLRAEDHVSPLPPRLQGIRAACYRMLGEAEGERQALNRALRMAPPDHQGFFATLWPLLDDMAPREAAGLSSRLREVPGQEDNPNLLLFEADALLRSKERTAARAKLEMISEENLPEGLRQTIAQLKHKLGPGPRPQLDDRET